MSDEKTKGKNDLQDKLQGVDVDMIDKFRTKREDKYTYTYFEQHLHNILDLERGHRRISLGLLQPSEFLSLDISYKNVINIINLVSKFNLNLNNLLLSKEDISAFKNS